MARKLIGRQKGYRSFGHEPEPNHHFQHINATDQVMLLQNALL
jgi:hypothetical protein